MSKVHVVLVDASVGEVIGEADLPLEQLPESFAAPTTLHLGGRDWTVERAEPVTRLDFASSGRLRLTLRKVEHVDPSKILFSLPTLENQMPPAGAAAGDAWWMHEDDWRQHELISARFASEIAAELSEIRTIHASHRQGVGFTNLHVRERIPAPLSGVQLTLADLGVRGARRSVALGAASDPSSRTVASSFAFELGGGTLYGREDAGLIVALCLDRAADPTPLAQLARVHDLILVDWCPARLQRSDGTSFA